ncbi:hypothetical protein SCLCIDRAFT_10696 [Scleroderma citrinum Foug A]|uniref:Uncharacterized protein n=1 Tax=Scleroderma citrinum Foug A TaxID=1036808 RepID=A0A0C3DJW5_9AGAM|nr:hypothetical protein SCLCIDRAFT_10696 [Scleroderma citrinum Foug A]
MLTPTSSWTGSRSYCDKQQPTQTVSYKELRRGLSGIKSARPQIDRLEDDNMQVDDKGMGDNDMQVDSEGMRDNKEREAIERSEAIIYSPYGGLEDDPPGIEDTEAEDIDMPMNPTSTHPPSQRDTSALVQLTGNSIETIATEKNFPGRPSMWMETVTMPERTYQWRIKTIAMENLPISKFERMPSNLLASYVQPPSRIHQACSLSGDGATANVVPQTSQVQYGWHIGNSMSDLKSKAPTSSTQGGLF